MGDRESVSVGEVVPMTLEEPNMKNMAEILPVMLAIIKHDLG